MTMNARSESSLEFQRRWAEGLESREQIPKRSSFDFLAFSDFIPQLVIAEVNLKTKTMPIVFAGNAIRDFVGFELTTWTSWILITIQTQVQAGRTEELTMINLVDASSCSILSSAGTKQ